MDKNTELQKHIIGGIEKIVTDAMKAVLTDGRESAFLARFAADTRTASKKRLAAEKRGEHVPGFLIASITGACNLHCAGCYARGINSTSDTPPSCQLTGEEWLDIFRQAQELGISFILLVGGEPLLRRDVLEAAASVKNIMFPVITNGTYIDEAYLDLFDKCRNIAPVLSLEGGREATDKRRGEGMYDVISGNMLIFKARGLLFGASVTVTTENLREVTSKEFIASLTGSGCKTLFYIEFVPVKEEDRRLAPGDKEREYMEKAVEELRRDNPGLLILSFPGDELALGGCMAAGREFFHINSAGGAEPCPFSPFSDINVKNTSLKEALASELFVKIRDAGLLLGEHKGGCVLYDKREQVRELLY